MKYSNLFGKTIKKIPADVKTYSHRFMYQGGYIRESSAGRYFILPLGMRVQQKVMNVIKEEMDAAGAQEMLSPILHPLSLWQETNRDKSTSYELTVVKDRRQALFALGATAEEMFVDVVRKFQLSYKDLPLNIYQFSTKFRDELRARGGLLRVREFIMKDAYSFDAGEENFKKQYQNMKKTYTRIFDRLGLKTVVVESDNGYIGGDYCHEFVVESEVGETKFLTTEDGSYAAHEDIAKFHKNMVVDNEVEQPKKDVEGKGIIGVEALADYLKIPVEKTTKTILFETEKGEVVAAAIQGMYDINEVKLKHVLGCTSLKLASPEVVRNVTGADVGYAGLLNLPNTVRIVCDESMKGRKNFEMGANKTDYHSMNVNFGRDLAEPETYYDIALAKEGYTAPDGRHSLIEKKGIEVGNIFQLGYYYSDKMVGASFMNKEGREEKYYMGCYGIGIGRTVAAIVESYHDDKGIVWPKIVAPFQTHLIGLDMTDASVKQKSTHIYEYLRNKGIEVLFDDREDAKPGEKFADADLIGIPTRLIVSKRTGDQIEIKKRGEKDSKVVSLDEVVQLLS